MHNENDYEWLFRKAPVMTTSIAEDGCYLDVNDAMLDRLGYALHDMVGHKPEEFATPESAERIVSELRPLLRRRGKLENKYISFVGASGEVVDCIANAFVEYDREGQFLRTDRFMRHLSRQNVYSRVRVHCLQVTTSSFGEKFLRRLSDETAGSFYDLDFLKKAHGL